MFLTVRQAITSLIVLLMLTLVAMIFMDLAHAQAPVHNSVTLQWTPPTMYTDGSAIPATETITYNVLGGTSPTNLAAVATGVAANTWTSPAEPAGSTQYFEIVAHDVQQNSDSAPTNPLSVAIAAAVPGAPGNVKATVN